MRQRYIVNASEAIGSHWLLDDLADDRRRVVTGTVATVPRFVLPHGFGRSYRAGRPPAGARRHGPAGRSRRSATPRCWLTLPRRRCGRYCATSPRHHHWTIRLHEHGLGTRIVQTFEGRCPRALALANGMIPAHRDRTRALTDDLGRLGAAGAAAAGGFAHADTAR